jgi:hypothetical protein
MRHEVAMKRLSVDQQIDLVRQMLSEMTLSVDQAGALQEQLIGLYGQKVEKEADRIQSAYNDAMDAVSENLDTKLGDIDSRLKKTIDPLKQQLKDLEGDARQTDRDRAEAEHNRKISDLQKERRKESLRLGTEHQAAVKRLDQEIADENRHWQEQQDDWKLDVQKRGIQEKIDKAEEGAKTEREQAQDAAKKQRKDLEDHYKEVKRITESGILETIASLAATNPQWFATGQGLIDQLIAGLKSGDFSAVLAQIASVKAAADEAAAAAARAAQSAAANPPGSALGILDQVQALIAANNYAQAAQLLSTVPGMTLDLAKANIKSQVGHDIPGFASGLWRVPYDEMPANLHRDETVLPAYAASAFRTFTANIGGIDRLYALVERVLGALSSIQRPTGDIKVYGAEHAYLEDPVDVDLLGNDIARKVVRATGG